jgi:hypothetical protein
MMPYSAYQLYQAERIRTDAEWRQADVELSQRAAAHARLRADVTRPVRGLRRHRAGRSPAAGCPGAIVGP